MFPQAKLSRETNAQTERHRTLQRRVNRLLALRWFLERQGLAICVGAAIGGFLAADRAVILAGGAGFVVCVAARVAADLALGSMGLRQLRVSVETSIVDPADLE